MQDITERIAYLRKHVKFIKNNPGLVLCLEYGIDTLDRDIRNILDKNCSHVICSLQDSKKDLISKFNEIIEEKDLEIMRLKRVINLFKEKVTKIQALIQIIEVQKNKILRISKSWKYHVIQNNENDKVFMSRLEEKMRNVSFMSTKHTAEKSTQSGTKA